MPEGDADKLAVLLLCDTEWHTEAIASSLRGRGIAAQAEGGYVVGWKAEVPAKARVMVFTRDLLRARLLLSELRAEASSIDWDTVDVGENLEGVPEPAGKIGPDAAAESPEATASRRRALLLTVAGLVGGVALLVLASVLQGRR